MTPARRPALFLVALVALDQLTKSWAVASLSDGRVVHVLWTLQFALGFNSGIAFSQAQGMGVLVAIVALVAVAFLVRAMVRSHDPLPAIAYAMVAAGALGNVCDRVFRGDGFLDGHVVDFIDLQWFPSFNVADAAITVGVVLLIGAMLTGRHDAGRGTP